MSSSVLGNQPRCVLSESFLTVSVFSLCKYYGIKQVLGTSRTARKGDVGVAIDHFVANEQSDILRDEAVQLRMTTAPSPASPTSCGPNPLDLAQSAPKRARVKWCFVRFPVQFLYSDHNYVLALVSQAQRCCAAVRG